MAPPNQAPVVGNGARSVAEDAAGIITSSIAVSDPDLGDSVILSATAGTYGSFSIQNNGTWTYDLDQGSATVQQLKPGSTLIDTITVTGTDIGDLTDTGTVTITIRGANDRPVVTDATASVNEGAGAAITGTLTVTDADAGDHLELDATAAAHGTFTIDDVGNWSYTLDNADASVAALAAGQSLTDTLTVTASDDFGGIDTGTLTVTINGVNDAPVVGDATGAIDEDDAGTVTGSVSVADADDGDSVTMSTAAGTYGTLSIQNDGSWSYDLDETDATVQALAVGQSLTDTITVTGTDGGAATDTGTVAITIAGVNDVPTIGDGTGTIAGNSGGSVTGSVAITEIDTGDSTTMSAATGAYGTLTIADDGDWSYDVDETSTAVRTLLVGQSLTDTITVTGTDGSGGSDTGTVTITVTGANDVPEVGDATASVIVSAAPVTGSVTVGDPDPGDSVTLSASDESYGTLTLSQDGSWSYDPDESNGALQALGPADTLTETITVTGTDGDGLTDTGTITITIQGENRAPVVGDATGIVDEDALGTIRGNVAVSDPDTDSVTLAISQGSYGSATINQSGRWVYDLDQSLSVVQSLQAGDTLTDTLTVTGTDPSGATDTGTVTVTIEGSNDAPLVTDATATVAASETGSISGGALATDIDIGDTVSVEGSSMTYGTVTFAEDTSWSYDLDQSDGAVVALAAGQTLTDTSSVTATDLFGEVDTGTLTVTITGVNDGPSVGDAADSVGEDRATALTGSVTVSDPDTGDNVTMTAAAGAYGTLTIADDGDWSYDLDEAATAVQALASGQTLTDTITVTGTDGSGATDTGTVTITIDGANDAPTVGDAEGTVDEDDTGPVTGAVTVADIDTGDTVEMTAAAGTYGNLTIQDDGSWSYDLDESDGTVQALRAGQTLTDAITVTGTDDDGATDTGTVTITITGVNDAPVVGDATGTIAASSAGTVTGSLAFSDTDTGDSIDFTAAAGTYGTLTVASDGDWSYDLDEADAAVLALAAGQDATDTIIVTGTDGAGGTDTGAVTITVTGVNDAPVVGDGTETVGEDTVGEVAGSVSVVDVDTGDSVLMSATAATYGVFNVENDGSWTYDLDESDGAVQALAVGESLTDTITVTGTDGSAATDTGTITFTIAGVNDAPTVTDDTGTIDEDSAGTVTGTVSTADIDNGDSVELSAAAGAYGTLTVDGDGNWSYDLNEANAAVQALAAGQSMVDTVTVTGTDTAGGTGTGSVAITITGANDAPVVGDATGTVNENATGSITGSVGVTEIDTGDSVTMSAAAGTWGTLSIQNDGTWSYNLNEANSTVQALAVGQTLTDTITVTGTDGSAATDTGTVTITVTGVNDAPAVGGGTGSIGEDSTGTVTGAVSVVDIDVGDTVSLTAANGAYGTLVVDNSGNWTYDLNESNATVQALAAGQTLIDTAIITGTDSANDVDVGQIVITIAGANDAPVIGDTTGAVTEDTVGAVTGSVSVLDVDVGNTVTMSATDATYGTFSIQNNGSWSYDVNEASATLQALAAGQTLTDTITVTGSDGTLTDTGTVTITITGVNDNPVVGDATGTIGEDSTGTVTGSVTFSDVDAGSAVSLSAATGSYGALTIDGSGNWSYDLTEANSAVQALAAGQTLTDTVVVTGSDGVGGSDTGNVVITISGANDAPVVGDGTGTVTEDNASTITGSVSVTDIDSGDTPIMSAAAGAYGTLAIQSDGSWTYDLDETDAAVQALASGQSLTDTIAVTATDGSSASDGGTVTITITGVNDAPTVGDGSGAIGEDSTGTVTGTLSVADIDTGSSVTLSAATGAYGALSVDDDGGWSYDLDETSTSVQALADGQTLTDTITVTGSDGAGGTDTGTVAITITGANDAPTVGDGTGSIAADRVTPIAGAVSVVDIDTGDTVTMSASAAAYGELTIAAGGAWTYTVDGDDPAVLALAAGQTLTDTITVTGEDGTGATDTGTVTVTITGVNDAPTIVGDSGAIDEDATTPITGSVVAADPDDGDTVTLDATEAAYGTLSLEQDGSWSYLLDATNPTVQALAAGDSLTDTVTVTATDQDELDATATIEITVAGANDAPTIEEAPTFDVLEDGTLTTSASTGVLAGVVDPEGDDLEAVLDSGPLYGSFTFEADGSFTYVADSAEADELAGGETLEDSFTYYVTDGELQTEILTATVVITGIADGVISGTPFPDGSKRGTIGEDIMTGGRGNDWLRGLANDDVLRGEKGNDRLQGDEGDDELTGGAGTDRFVLNAPGDGFDIVTDFNLKQDKLVIDDILEGYSQGNATSFIRLASGDGSTSVELDVDGGGNDFEAVAELSGVTVTLAQLLAKGAIEVT